MLLALSLTVATVSGLALNGWLLCRIQWSDFPKWYTILVALIFALLLHQLLLLSIVRTIVVVLEVPPDQQETVGYFVGPNLLVFVAAPLALLLCRLLSRARTEQPTPHSR